jgi:hypothetical protein
MRGFPQWRWRGGTSMGRRIPEGAASLLSYKRWSPFPPSFRHLVHSIPYLVAPPIRRTLSEALPKLLATNTWRSGGGEGGILADPYFRCPAGPWAWRTSPNRTYDRVCRRCRLWRLIHDLEIIKWTTTSTTYIYTILRSSSDRLCSSSLTMFVRERKYRFRSSRLS